MKKRKSAGIYFVLPWVIGFILFTLLPMIAAVFISFTDWSIVGSNTQWIGLANYREIFQAEQFWHALWITFRYAIIAIPLVIVTSFTVSVMLSKNIRHVGIYRVIYYMPAIVSGVAVSIVFRWILDPNNGLINFMLSWLGINGPNWLYDPEWVLPSYLIMAVWGAGGGILTYLSALKDVPTSLYESAEMDGANQFQKTWYITVPMMTPIIFYNLIIGIISAFRKFTDAYVLGGAGGEGEFYMVYLYEQAFAHYKMGYATALAWILFIVIMFLTVIVNVSKKFWVHTA
jgi:multiple sugar transport system permease protein